MTAPTLLPTAPSGDPRPRSGHAVLTAQMHQAGLLTRSGLGYLTRGLAVAALAVAGLVGFVLVGDSWWQLVVAGYFAVVFAQVGFLGHDAGHQQVFVSRRRNDRLGLLLSNLGIGISYRWWVDKHNAHHRSPNDPHADPDIAPGVVAWTAGQVPARGVGRWFARHQGPLFVPLLLLEALNLHANSVMGLFARRRGHRVEAVLLAAHVAGVVTGLLLVMSPLKALAVLGLQQGLFGLYLGGSFAPNHKGMPLAEDGPDPDFVLRQVLTSRNVSGGRTMDAALGGLNYQIEHHLFPSMPSANLRRARPIVQRFCAERAIPYAETTLLRSYAQALRYLHGVREA